MRTDPQLHPMASKLAALAVALLLVLSFPAEAQVVPRLVDGGIIGLFGGNDNSISQGDGEVCPCPPFPFPLGEPVPGSFSSSMFYVPDGATIVPVRPEGAMVVAGSAVGDPIQFTRASEFTLSTGADLGPTFVGSPTFRITTMFTARNQLGTFSSGGGPGSTITNPLRSASFPGGATLVTTLPTASGTITTTLTRPAIPIRSDGVLAAIYTAGPRQFGGTLRILNLYGNSVWSTTTDPPGILQRGVAAAEVPIGTPISVPTFYPYVHETAGVVKVGFGARFGGLGWTTGTVTVRQLEGRQTSFAVAGFDMLSSGTLMRRSVQLVVPSFTVQTDLGTGLVFQWNMQFLPEPGAAASLAGGLGLLGLLYRRRMR